MVADDIALQNNLNNFQPQALMAVDLQNWYVLV
jgi:hypothetical protein